MNISLSAVLSQLEGAPLVAALFDLSYNPESRWQALQSLISASPRWKSRVKWCLAMKREGESESDILSWLINDLNLIHHVGSLEIRLNARLLRSMLSAEQIQNYEEGFGWLLRKQLEHEAGKKKLKPRGTRGKKKEAKR